jgi:hypothetical protein
MNAAIWWESQIERDYIYLLESDPIVLSYKSQPFSMNYTSQGKKRTYTPDFWVKRADFQQAVEVKPITQINTEKNQKLFHYINLLCQEKGLDFVVVTDRMIRIQPKLDNLKLLYKYARTPLTLNKYLDCQRYFRNREATSLKQVWQELEPRGISKNLLYKLLYIGALQTDLMQPISSESLIQLSPFQGDVFRIATGPI